jgi:hypothetical protein
MRNTFSRASLDSYVNMFDPFLKNYKEITTNAPLDGIRVELEKSCKLMRNQSIYLNMKNCSLKYKIKCFTEDNNRIDIDIRCLEDMLKCKIVKIRFAEYNNNLPSTDNHNINRYIFYFTNQGDGLILVMIELEHNLIKFNVNNLQ